MKKIISLALFCLCFLFVFSSCENKGELWLNECKIDAFVDENGMLFVREKWVAETSSSEGYRNFYRTITTFDDKFDAESTFSLLSVYNETEQKYLTHCTQIKSESDLDFYAFSHYQNTFYCIETDDCEYVIGVILPTLYPGETVSFTFEYTYENFASSYADIAETDWLIFDEYAFEMYISDFSATVTFPEKVDFSDKENTYAWLHCTAESTLSLEKNTVTATAKKMDARTQAGIHVLVPTSSFDSLQKTTTENGLERFIAEEDQWQNEWLARQKLLSALSLVDVIGCGVCLVFSLVSVPLSYALSLYRIKEKRYLREIPKDWTVGEMSWFFYHYKRGGVKKYQGAVLSACMLELARKNYLDILPTQDGEYTIQVIPVSDRERNDLNDYEIILFQLLTEVQTANGAPFTMQFFERYSKKNANTVWSKMELFNKKTGGKFRSVAHCKKQKGIFFIIALLFFFGSILALMSGYFQFLPIGGIIGAFIMFLGCSKIDKMGDEGNALYADTIALKNYLLDFSNLKDYDIPQLVLWEEYLVYATMMGISDKVVRSLQANYPELTECGYDPAYMRRGYLYSYMYLYSRPYHAGVPFDLGKSMVHSVSTIKNVATATQTLAKTNSFHGSGGHGGSGFRGGGGFGGGGGGGRH